MWERDGRFGAAVENAWMATGRAQSVSAISAKLAHMATELQKWGRATFGSVREELRNLRRKLGDLRAEQM